MGLMLNGTGVSKGIAIGKACLLKRDELEIGEFIIPKPLLGEEIARYRAALKKTRIQLKNVRKRIAESVTPEIASFVDAHLLMIKDSVISEQPVEIIRQRQCNAEWALKVQRDSLIDVFETMADPYLSARKDDVYHVVERIQRNLQDLPELAPSMPSDWLNKGIVVTEDISPDDLIMLQHQGILALVTEYGAANSHTAILARNLGIPVVAAVRHCRHYIAGNELLIVDGTSGAILVTPDAMELAAFRNQLRADREHLLELDTIRDEPAVTQDGQQIRLMANMELPEDIALIRKSGAAGIGLFRTELLFMSRESFPSEEEQFAIYRNIAQAMEGKPVTIRTIDFGMDKTATGTSLNPQVNPALGLRAIRLCLKNQSLFVPQIRAVLRASAYGNVRMMIPLLTSVHEVLEVLRLVEKHKSELAAQNIAYDAAIPVGGMIEVPAAALQVDDFSRHLDFLSIGTNDLIQYTLAVDRLNDEVNYLCDPLHPAILRLIKMVIDAGRKAGIPVAMCGEMAGDTRYSQLLLGMGLKEFSMYAASILEVKQIINSSNAGRLAARFKQIEQMMTAEEIAGFIDNQDGRFAAFRPGRN